MADRKLVVHIFGDNKDLQRAFRSSSRSAGQFEAQLKGTSRGVRNLFAAAGVTLGAAAFVRAIRSTVTAAISFESSFAGVRKTVTATEPQLQELALGFRALSREIPVSVDQLNRIGEAAGQLGIRRAAILGFTRTVADLGATTNLSADEAANALARLANITRLPQNEFDRLGATIADLGNKLAATESEIVDFGLRIAAAGKIIGLTEAQTLAVAGAFTSVGVEAEAGGTAVSKVFIALANAVETGGKKLEAFAQTAGTSTAQFRRLFEQDTAAAFNAFVVGLARVDKEGGNVFKTLRDLGLTDQRLTRAFLSISQSGDLLSRSLAIGSKAWRENAALTREAEKRYSTTASQLQKFLNRVNDLQITLGEALAPALIKIVEPLGEWAAKTENQRDLQRKLQAVVGTSTDVVRAFVDVARDVAPVLERVNKLLGGTRNAVKLLITVLVVSKLVNFASSITGLGVASQTATGRVLGLRTALTRLGAIGVITVGVQLIMNRKSIDQQVRGFLQRNKLGFLAGGQKIDVPVDVDSNSLQVIRDRLAEIKGDGDLLVKTLDFLIQKLREAEAVSRGSGSSSRGEGRSAEAIARSNQVVERQARKAAEDAAKAINEATAARQRAAAATQKETDAAGKVAAATKDQVKSQRELRQIERDRAQARVQRRQGGQFEALGLTAEGAERIPGVGALRGRLGSLREQLKGSPLDTEQTRKQLARIAKVLSGAFGKAGRDVRSAILGMLNDISSALDQGGKQGPLTKTSGLNTKKILEGLGLSEEETRELRGRLSSFNTAGRAPAGSQNRPTGGGFTGGTGFVIENNVTVQVGSQKIAAVVTKEEQKRKRRNPQQKRGPNRHR